MHGNLLNKNKSKMFLTANSDLAARISILENNVYKVTYYEIISGASGTLTVPTGATINSGEFSGANCILSEIDGSNKPTFVTPLDGGGTPVTATLNVGTGAWVKSGVTVSTNVALIYSVDITAADYQNLNNFYIIDNVLISSLSQVLTNSGTASTLSSELSRVISDETGSGALVFGTSPTFTTDITVPRIYGGTGVNDGIDFYSTSGNGTSGSTAHRFLGGNNGATTILTMLNDGTIRIPNNRVIQGTDSAGTNRSLITWSSGDNITISGRPGVSDVVINPTSGGVGLYVKSGGDGGIGVASPSARWHIVKTTEQLRVGYDTSNYISTTVVSTGEVTYTLVGSTRNFNFSSAGSMSIKASSAAVTSYLGCDGSGGYVGTATAHAFRVYSANVQRLSFAGSGTGDCSVTDGLNFILGTTTGHKFGTATTQKLSFWNKTPIVQPTTGITGATKVAGGGTTVTDTDTFGGYTIAQLAAVVINTGLAA